MPRARAGVQLPSLGWHYLEERMLEVVCLRPIAAWRTQLICPPEREGQLSEGRGCVNFSTLSVLLLRPTFSILRCQGDENNK